VLKKLVVLDTNVFVSGLLTPHGIPGLIIKKFRERQFEIATSPRQIAEIKDVLKRPSLHRALPRGTPMEVLRFFASLKKLTKVFDPPPLPWDFKDKGDHFLLDLVIESNAHFLITGDHDLQDLALIQKCVVLSPADFIQRIT